MSDLDKQQEVQNGTKDKSTVRREKLASFFYDISKLVFAGLVVGGISPIFTDVSSEINYYLVITGIFLTIVFAAFANWILK